MARASALKPPVKKEDITLSRFFPEAEQVKLDIIEIVSDCCACTGVGARFIAPFVCIRIKKCAVRIG